MSTTVRGRRLKRALLGLAGLTVLVVMSVWLITSTQPGARFVIRQLPRFGVPIRVTALEGPLRGPLILYGVRIETDATLLEIRRLSLDWRLGGLIRRRLTVDDAQVNGAVLVLRDREPSEAEAPRQATEPRELELPIRVVVRQAQVRDLRIRAPGDLELGQGAVSLTGALEDYRLEATGVLTGPRIATARLQLNGEGTLNHIELKSARLEALDGVVQARGRVIWTPEVKWQIEVDANELAPANVLDDPAPWPGTISLRARSAGSLSEAGPLGTIELDTLSGRLREQPVSGRGSVTLEGATYRLRGLTLEWGTAAARAEGVVGDSLDLRFSLSAPDLARTLPRAAGALRIDGSVGGSRALPTLRATLAAHGVRLARARLDELTGHVDFDAGRPDAVDLDLQGVRLGFGGRAIDRLTLRARGTRSQQDPGSVLIERAEAELLGGRVHMGGRLTWRPEVRWDVHLEAERLAPASLLTNPSEWPGSITLRASSEGALTADGPSGRVQIDTLHGALRGQRLSARAQAEIAGVRYSLPRFDLLWGPTQLRASGELTGALNLDFDLDAPDLALVYPGAGGSFRASGQLGGTRALPTLRATLEADSLVFGGYRLGRLGGRVDLGRADPGGAEVDLAAERLALGERAIERLVLRGRGIREERALVGLALDTVRAELLDGLVLASGRVLWHPQRSWQLSIAADTLAPASLFPRPERWPGRLSLRGRTDGSLEADGRRVTVQIDTLFGSLREQPVSARSSVTLEGSRVSLEALQLGWGATRLSAVGVVADDLDLRFEFTAPDLARTWPDAAGSLDVSGGLGGSRDLPQLQASVAGRSLVFRDYGLGQLSGRVNLDLGDPGTANVSLEAADLRLRRHTIDRITLDSRGSRSDHEVTATLRSRDPTIELRLAGGLVQENWSGVIRRLDVVSGTAGNYRLANPVPLSLSRTAARLGDLCLESDVAALCSEGEWESDGGWNVVSSFRRIPLAAATPVLPQGWSLDGTLEGTIEASVAADGSLAAAIELYPGPGDVTYPLGVDTQRVRFERGALQLYAGPDGTRGEARLNLSAASGAPFGMLNANLQLPEYRDTDQPLRSQPLSGRLEARLEDLSLLEALSTRLARTGGRLEADVHATGTVEAPGLLGELRLVEGRADIPALGTRLRDIQITAAGDGQGAATFSGQASSGPGRLTVSGTSPLRPTASSPATLRIQGERFQAMNTPEISLLVSPNVEATMTGDRVMLSGEVRIPHASIHLREIPETAVPISKDVVFVGPALEPQPAVMPVSGRVRLVLGDDVSFRGFGFTAGLTGSILATEEPGKPTAGTGELVIRNGQYKAYGQNLTIDPGRVIFGGGPIDDPGLDVRAYRVAEDSIIAGLLIKGTLKAPEVTLFSEPPMAESEALAYLVLGRPLGEASRTEGNAVSKAAESLGLRGGNLLARRIAATVGLDEARIETRGSLEQASFVAGKYLSPKLYVSYGIGLFDHASTFRVRYLLSSRWTLVGETGTETSTDILYRIERGN